MLRITYIERNEENNHIKVFFICLRCNYSTIVEITNISKDMSIEMYKNLTFEMNDNAIVYNVGCSNKDCDFDYNQRKIRFKNLFN